MTAIMCGDDHVAISTIHTALQMGIPVPEKLSIVGFSDIQLAAYIPTRLRRFDKIPRSLLDRPLNC